MEFDVVKCVWRRPTYYSELLEMCAGKRIRLRQDVNLLCFRVLVLEERAYWFSVCSSRTKNKTNTYDARHWSIIENTAWLV